MEFLNHHFNCIKLLISDFRDTVQPAEIPTTEVVMTDHKAPEMETDVDFDDR